MHLRVRDFFFRTRLLVSETPFAGLCLWTQFKIRSFDTQRTKLSWQHQQVQGEQGAWALPCPQEFVKIMQRWGNFKRKNPILSKFWAQGPVKTPLPPPPNSHDRHIVNGSASPIPRVCHHEDYLPSALISLIPASCIASTRVKFTRSLPPDSHWGVVDYICTWYPHPNKDHPVQHVSRAHFVLTWKDDFQNVQKTEPFKSKQFLVGHGLETRNAW